MKESNIQEIAKYFKDLNIDQATIKVLGKEYDYETFDEITYKWKSVGNDLPLKWFAIMPHWDSLDQEDGLRRLFTE